MLLVTQVHVCCTIAYIYNKYLCWSMYLAILYMCLLGQSKMIEDGHAQDLLFGHQRLVIYKYFCACQLWGLKSFSKKTEKDFNPIPFINIAVLLFMCIPYWCTMKQRCIYEIIIALMYWCVCIICDTISTCFILHSTQLIRCVC